MVVCTFGFLSSPLLRETGTILSLLGEVEAAEILVLFSPFI